MNQEIKKIIANHAAVMIYFYSNQCAPCIALKPKIKSMVSAHFPLIKQYYIDAETVPQQMASLQVFTAPTLLFFFDGKETLRLSNYISIEVLKHDLSRYYQLLFDK